jgi:hypothetical protein
MVKKSGSAGYKSCQMIIHNFFRSSKRTETAVAGGNLALVLDHNEMGRPRLVRLIQGRRYMVKGNSSAEEFL